MLGVVGGVSPRTLDQGQSPSQYRDLLSASTTLLQSGGGGFARLINALQALDQTFNLSSLENAITELQQQVAGIAAQIGTINGQISTLQGQVDTNTSNIATLQGQVATNTSNIATNTSNIATLQGQVSTLQGQVQALQLFMNSFNYNQIEVSTGTIFLDQRTIYRRSIVINGALNGTNVIVTTPHTIAAINYIVTIQGVAALAGGQFLPLTYVQTNTQPITNGIGIWADTANIYVSNGSQVYTNYQVLATLFYTATNR